MKKFIVPIVEVYKPYKPLFLHLTFGLFVLYAAFYVSTSLGEYHYQNYCIVAVGLLSGATVHYTAMELNRFPRWYSVAGVFLPFPMLLVMPFVYKLNFRFEIDFSFPPDVQLKEIREYADKFRAENKDSEAGFIYQYIISELPYTEQDLSIYNELKEKVSIPGYKTIVK